MMEKRRTQGSRGQGGKRTGTGREARTVRDIHVQDGNVGNENVTKSKSMESRKTMGEFEGFERHLESL